MVVLVVDDQVSVVSAILSGVHWDKIGVEEVLTAYNAFEAKNILRTKPVDILLCDIEMPSENGLRLFRWAKEGNYELECIFLTSHADFHYAKEALTLGSIDYILQPARYEDVQASLQKAVQRVQEKREYDAFYSYGKLVKNERGLLLDSLLGKYLWSEQINPEMVDGDMKRLGIEFDVSKPFCVATLLMVSPSQEAMLKNDELFRYGLSNILAELGAQYGQKTLLLRYGTEGYICFVYSMQAPLVPQVFRGFLEYFLKMSCQYLKNGLTAYSGGQVNFVDLPGVLKKLTRLRDETINLSSKVICLDEDSEDLDDSEFLLEQKHWDWLVSQNDFKAMAVEMEQVLTKMEEGGKLTSAKLQQAYQHFVRMVYRALSERNLDIRDIFSQPGEWQQFMTAYRSLDDVKTVLSRTAEVFSENFKGSGDAESQMETMVRYIHDHIEKDIHRSDVAASVYLSPDYVSHLFKEKMHMSLSEFVISEKMKLARTLLRTGSLPISVIATKVGYTNFSYFSRTYKKVFGCTPASERKIRADGDRI